MIKQEKTLAQINFEKTEFLHKDVWGTGVGFYTFMAEGVESGLTVDETLEQFDYDGFARKLHQLGAGFCIVTLNQTTKYFSIPNEAYEKYSGYPRGVATPNVDPVARLLDAFEPYGIDMLLNLSCDGPSKDPQAREGFGTITFGTGLDHPPFSVEFVKKWSEVVRETSLRYGKRIKGWWFDGLFYEHGYNEEKVAMIANAALSGNPDAVVASNIYGLMQPPNERDEYMREGAPTDHFTFGEMWTYEEIPKESMLGHCRWHIWSWFTSLFLLLKG